MSPTFKVPAVVDGVSPLKDGGVSVRFHTQEMTPGQIADLMGYYQKFGWLIFSEQEQDVSQIKLDTIRKDAGGKSPSQRLRSVIFVLYSQTDRSETFEQFYERQMEKLINMVKENLT